MRKLIHDANQDDSRIIDAIGALASEGKPCESAEAMQARTGISPERVKRSYLRLYYSGFPVPFPAQSPAQLREALAEAARALHPLAGVSTVDEDDSTVARDEWIPARVLGAEVCDARAALTRIEDLLHTADREPPVTPPAITADCEVPPPLGFARRVQVPKAALIDAIAEAASALGGDSNDSEHDALVILRAELESWAAEDFSVADIERITASRRIGDAVIRQNADPSATALRRLVNRVERSGELALRRAPVRVARSRITADMCVPCQSGADRLGDIDAGAIAANLFTDAVAKGALVAPEGVRIECYGDDDQLGGGFVLIAFPEDPHTTRGVTAGWRDATNIAAAQGEDPHDRKLVLAALEFFASELNHALGAPAPTAE